MSWSLFGNKNKFQKRNQLGYDMFRDLFSDFFRIAFSKTVDEWLEQGWNAYDADYKKTKAIISGGFDPKMAGFNISMQLNNALYEQTRNLDPSKDTEYYDVIGNGLAISHIARILFGWAPAISESTRTPVDQVLNIMINSALGLISDADMEEDDHAMLVNAYNDGYREMMDLSISYLSQR